MGIEAILWDMDGVLIDSEGQKYDAWRRAIENNGGREFREEDYMKLVGTNSLDIIFALVEKGFITKDVAEIVLRERDYIYDTDGINRVQAIDSSAKLLMEIDAIHRREGIPRQARVSSESEENINKNLQRLGLYSCFEYVLSIADQRPKPAPDGYIVTAEKLGLSPTQCVAIEDTFAGV